MSTPRYDPRWTPAWRRARADWAPIVATGTIPCARCQRLILPGSEWDLGHPDRAPAAEHPVLTPELLAQLHPEHRLCSRQAGARYGNHRRAASRARLTAQPDDLWPTPPSSRT